MAVDLENDAVDLVIHLVPAAVPLFDEGHDFSEGSRFLDGRVDGQSPTAQMSQILGVPSGRVGRARITREGNAVAP
jgi:hypothetical protein